MFTKSAKFYDALYHFKDYKKASEILLNTLHKFNPGAKSLLDVACGTGKHIEDLRNHIQCEGLDISGELIEIAKKRCPGINFYVNDMTDFCTGKKYDAVTCLFSSVAYVKSFSNLQKAVKCMSDHLNENGLLIIEPWFSKKTFWTDTITSNHYDEKDLKITWMYTSKIENDLSVLDINYLAGTPEEVSFFRERHELGLFDDGQYREAFLKCGLKVEFDEKGMFGRGMYIGIKK